VRPSAGGFYALLAGLFLGPGSAVQAAHLPLGLLWTQLFAFLLPAAAASAGANLQPRRFLLLARRPTARQLGLALAAGAAGFAVASALVALFSLLLPRSWVEAHDVSRLFVGSPARRGIMLALTAGLAPVCEEIAFRGYLQSALRARLSDRDALLVGATLFAALHLNPVSLPGLFLLGLLFGWLALRSGSVWPAAVAHGTNNAISSVLALGGAREERLRPEEAAGIVWLLALGLLGLAAAVTAYLHATPDPPAAAEAVARVDPAVPAGPFRLGRLPASLRWSAAAGLLALGALAAWASSR
jgi:membrane protease YdiL (CAAX protease family)